MTSDGMNDRWTGSKLSLLRLLCARRQTVSWAVQPEGAIPPTAMPIMPQTSDYVQHIDMAALSCCVTKKLDRPL